MVDALFGASSRSPNPKNPPLYLDLPRKAGEAQPDVLAKWAANAPLAFIDQYIGNLRQYRAISLDVGDKDGLRGDTGKLHDVLDKYGIANSFEVYQRHSYQRGDSSFPELCDAIFQQESMFREQL